MTDSEIIWKILLAGAVFWSMVSFGWWHWTYSWWFARRNHRKLGQPCESDIVLDRDGYSLGFSKKWKSALWASYIVSRRSVGIDVDRGLRFYPDPDVPHECRVTPEAYTNTGYDRGHLAPSGAIDFSVKSNTETFAMSNVVPQDPGLNRQAWGSLEKIIRRWTHTKGKLAVVTGPIYSQRPRRMNGVPVPSRFYKVVWSFRHKQCIGFVFPNKDIRASELWKYAMPVCDVEKETGYNFFSKFWWWKRKRKAVLDMDFWRGGSD